MFHQIQHSVPSLPDKTQLPLKSLMNVALFKKGSIHGEFESGMASSYSDMASENLFGYRLMALSSSNNCVLASARAPRHGLSTVSAGDTSAGTDAASLRFTSSST
eukprot:gb/GECG01011462.1/.p1 GENE.gb/GECG01011462.1/~~gb/GECG01011462.1/.p1  ORF type:complete len:105 (+),score=13.16 gb/GECG01011462.1/:1-315(+)